MFNLDGANRTWYTEEELRWMANQHDGTWYCRAVVCRVCRGRMEATFPACADQLNCRYCGEPNPFPPGLAREPRCRTST